MGGHYSPHGQEAKKKGKGRHRGPKIPFGIISPVNRDLPQLPPANSPLFLQVEAPYTPRHKSVAEFIIQTLVP